MSKEIKLSGITDSLKKFGLSLKKRTPIIFIVVALAALVYSLYSVNLLLGAPSDENYRTEQEAKGFSSHFDQKTIDAINNLKNREDASAGPLPGGRINPFSE